MPSAPVTPVMPLPLVIDTPDAFEKMMATLDAAPLLALDTESDSLFSYTPKVCLIQIAVPAGDPDLDPYAAHVFLVDCLGLDIRPLGHLLARPDLEIVMHAAENDMLTLGRDFGFQVQKIFDTQLAVRILGWPKAGLAAIFEQEFEVQSDKRMQRTNWGKRPLDPDQKHYAAMDAYYLLPLRVKLMRELHRDGRWEEAQEAFDFLSRLDLADKPLPERTVWSMKAARKTPSEQMGLLESLWEWREAEARRLDRPPFKVMNDSALLSLAANPPQQVRDLASVSGVSSQQASRYGRALMQAVRTGQTRTPSDPPVYGGRYERLDEPIQIRYDALRAWRTQRAQQRGVDPDIIFNNDTLMQIAANPPATPTDLTQFPAIGPWKARTYGPDLIRILAKFAQRQ